MFEPWPLAAMDDAGYNGIRDEHIDRVAESLLATGLPKLIAARSIVTATNAALSPTILHK